jgi:YHS domain-containing protein
MAIDPVCKMAVDEKAPGGGKAQYWGKYFYYCSKDCRVSFRRDPQKYVPESDEGRGPLYDKLGNGNGVKSALGS